MKYTFILICCLVLFLIVWPLIKWLAITIMVVGGLFTLFVLKDSKKIKKEIEKDPEKYYSEKKED